MLGLVISRFGSLAWLFEGIVLLRKGLGHLIKKKLEGATDRLVELTTRPLKSRFSKSKVF